MNIRVKDICPGFCSDQNLSIRMIHDWISERGMVCSEIVCG